MGHQASEVRRGGRVRVRGRQAGSQAAGRGGVSGASAVQRSCPFLGPQAAASTPLSVPHRRTPRPGLRCIATPHRLPFVAGPLPPLSVSVCLSLSSAVFLCSAVQCSAVRVMRVVIRPDYDEVSLWVASYIRDRIVDYAPTAARPFVLGLPTGSSPLGTYRYLVDFHARGQLSFQYVITFNMDEYVDLPRDHPESYHSFMWDNLFKHIDILPANVHILNGNAADLKLECEQYEETIRQVGGVELFLGGIGTDGHIAFNEPGSSLQSRTRVKTLAYETIVANARFFGNRLEQVPKMALTVGVATIMDAREVVIVISGHSKAAALERCIEQGVNHMFTLSAIQMHPCACIVCDDDATAELRVRTVRYFKGLEKAHNELIGGKQFQGDGSTHGQLVRSTSSSEQKQQSPFEQHDTAGAVAAAVQASTDEHTHIAQLKADLSDKSTDG